MTNPYGLKNCPFCGLDRVRVQHGLEGQISGIYCCNCHMLANWTSLPTVPRGNEPFSTVIDSWKKAWNKRGDGA